MFEISKKYRFEAAHRLTEVHEDHKCQNMHGHSYEVEIFCEQRLLNDEYMVVDYADMDLIIEPLLNGMDHSVLNERLPIEPTAERLAQWFYDTLNSKLPVSKVSVCENPDVTASYSE